MPQEPFMLSSKAKYALRALLRLTESGSPSTWLQTGEVAEQEQVPRKFLEAIFVQLRDQGIIESRRGAQGGYRLARDPKSISVADVIRILDGPLALTPCASRTRYRQCADCVEVKKCRLQPLMQEARDAVAGVLENRSLAQLSRPPKVRQNISKPSINRLDRKHRIVKPENRKAIKAKAASSISG
jgi:Rrf2 family protein